jgi:hypothetical protein
LSASSKAKRKLRKEFTTLTECDPNTAMSFFVS